MTVTYTHSVANARLCGFFKLLIRWRGSVYKLFYKEFLIYITLYAIVSVTYRFGLDKVGKQEFEKLCSQFHNYTDLVPISFVLGFYVTIVVGRWWSQFEKLPWPDRIMVIVGSNVHGTDERGRLLRRTLLRYLVQAEVLTYRSTSTAVFKRFPTMEHVVKAGIMTENEYQEYKNVKTENLKYWVPIMWFSNLLSKIKQEGRIYDDVIFKLIMEELNTFRSCCGALINYDWISIPLVYTQVVTVAVYMFFMSTLLSRQYLESNRDSEIDLYIPIFTIGQFFFYVGWLKVAEQLINPFGEDDDDFEVNSCIDRNMELTLLVADQLYNKHPKIEKDKYWGVNNINIPYTSASVNHKLEPFLGSTYDMRVDKSKRDLVVNNVNQLESILEINTNQPNPYLENSKTDSQKLNHLNKSQFGSLKNNEIRKWGERRKQELDAMSDSVEDDAVSLTSAEEVTRKNNDDPLGSTTSINNILADKTNYSDKAVNVLDQNPSVINKNENIKIIVKSEKNQSILIDEDDLESNLSAEDEKVTKQQGRLMLRRKRTRASTRVPKRAQSNNNTRPLKMARNQELQFNFGSFASPNTNDANIFPNQSKDSPLYGSALSFSTSIPSPKELRWAFKSKYSYMYGDTTSVASSLLSPQPQDGEENDTDFLNTPSYSVMKFDSIQENDNNFHNKFSPNSPKEEHSMPFTENFRRRLQVPSPTPMPQSPSFGQFRRSQSNNSHFAVSAGSNLKQVQGKNRLSSQDSPQKKSFWKNNKQTQYNVYRNTKQKNKKSFNFDSYQSSDKQRLIFNNHQKTKSKEINSVPYSALNNSNKGGIWNTFKTWNVKRKGDRTGKGQFELADTLKRNENNNLIPRNYSDSNLMEKEYASSPNFSLNDTQNCSPKFFVFENECNKVNSSPMFEDKKLKRPTSLPLLDFDFNDPTLPPITSESVVDGHMFSTNSNAEKMSDLKSPLSVKPQSFDLNLISNENNDLSTTKPKNSTEIPTLSSDLSTNTSSKSLSADQSPLKNDDLDLTELPNIEIKTTTTSPSPLPDVLVQNVTNKI